MNEPTPPNELARELSAFPIRFSEPVYFGAPPSGGLVSGLRNGTATILNLGSGPIAVTCSHVLACYRKLLAESPATTFQVGNLKLDPLPRIRSEDANLDLAIIDLEGCDLAMMQQGKVVESGVFQPTRWPPPPLEPGEFVAVGGFPGVWRDQVAPDRIHYDSFSLGATKVTTVHEDYFVCQFEREHWVASHEEHRDVRKLGGISGGPAFIYRTLYAEFVGICYEFSEDFDLLYVRPASLLGPDGTIGGK